MRQPTISIAMPVRNAENTISSAILSIMHQTILDWELIVVNDGCDDNTLEIVENFGDSRIKIIGDKQKLGIPFRLNQAIDKSRGKYFARMDADDICFPERFSIQLEYLQKNAFIDVVSSSMLVFDTDGHVNGVIKPYKEHHLICRQPWKGFIFPHPTWMGHLSWFRNNKYPTEANGIEDQNLLFKSYRHSNFSGIDKVLVAYRDDRNLKKILNKRILMLKSLGLRAIKQRDYINLIIMSLVLPVKCIGDCLFAITKCKYFRNKFHQAPVSVLSKWSKISIQCSIKYT
jgi:glycosyltransferase involved in cell wall biosynthesis